VHGEEHHALDSEPPHHRELARCAEHADGSELRGGVKIHKAHLGDAQLEGNKRVAWKVAVPERLDLAEMLERVEELVSTSNRNADVQEAKPERDPLPDLAHAR
jgi:hypothetical protein